MRFIFALFILLNIGLFAYGQGYFGPTPAEQGRSTLLPPPLQPDAIVLDEPLSS